MSYQKKSPLFYYLQIRQYTRPISGSRVHRPSIEADRSQSSIAENESQPCAEKMLAKERCYLHPEELLIQGVCFLLFILSLSLHPSPLSLSLTQKHTHARTHPKHTLALFPLKIFSTSQVVSSSISIFGPCHFKHQEAKSPVGITLFSSYSPLKEAHNSFLGTS